VSPPAGGPWYGAGLRFECTRCGHCCTGFPGTVTVNDEEITALAERVELDEPTFRERYTRVISDGTISLREKPNYDCVFWSREHGCLVYEVRPTQCRTWPFWDSNVASPKSWSRAAEHCPGMNRGRLYTIDEIDERVDETP
jgi:Fe-S-cluster containining protein